MHLPATAAEANVAGCELTSLFLFALLRSPLPLPLPSGVTKEFGIVTPMLALRPKLALGLFWREYAAENGIRLDGKGLASCRYDEAADHDEDDDGRAPVRAGGAAAGANGQRGCWGRIRGRLVYGNDFYHRGGNYPRSVLYACENHRDQDFADPAFHRCHVCEHLFPAAADEAAAAASAVADDPSHPVAVDASMWTPLICRVCFDQTNLQNKQTWIRLDSSASVRAFNFSDVVSRTIHVASRKNLPVSLRTFGCVEARLDYNIPDEVAQQQPHHLDDDDGAEEDGDDRDDDDGEERKLVRRSRSAAAAAPPPPIDLSAVPMSTFVAVNGWRVDETVRLLREKLTAAADSLNTRALLVYDRHARIEVLADKRVILDGREGEEHMELTVQAWHQALEILYPIVAIMILVLHFSVLFVKQSQATYDGTTNYSAYISQPASDSLDTVVILILAIVGVVLLLVAIFLVYRYRELCERCFKRFLVGDILLIFMAGVATLLWLLVAQWRVYLDTLTFCAIIWNLSMIGLLSLYYPMPERLHHFFLILLNAIMGIMMVATLGKWLVLTFLLLFALGDIVSELRPHMRFLSPFIIPQGVELIYTTPKILYTVGGLRLRAADLMCFGMVTGLALSTGTSDADYGSVLLGGALCFVCVLSSLALMLFVAPFVGVRFRPLPMAVLSAFACTMMEDDVFMPFILGQQNLTVRPVSFASA